jgi:hypothetical protein
LTDGPLGAEKIAERPARVGHYGDDLVVVQRHGGLAGPGQPPLAKQSLRGLVRGVADMVVQVAELIWTISGSGVEGQQF